VVVTSRESYRWNAGRLLAVRPLANLGTYSFGIYLWHWPIYMVVRLNTGEMPSITLGAAIILASIAMAYLSQKFADLFMKSAGARVKPGLLASICVATLLGLAALLYRGQALLGSDHYIRKLQETSFMNGYPQVTPGPLAVRSDSHRNLRRECQQDEVSPAVLRCDFGAVNSDTVVFLVGGSHSGHWLPALDVLGKARNWRIVSILKSACPFASPKDTTLYASDGYDPSCGSWNNAVVRIIAQERPDLVITLATRSMFAVSKQGGVSELVEEQVPEGFMEQWVMTFRLACSPTALWISRNARGKKMKFWTTMPCQANSHASRKALLLSI
jgi:hypothetical protein